jgi:hypothetical protein
MEEVERQTQWIELNAALENVMKSFGKSDPMGNGDYWILDDDWGGPWQKICIFNLKLLKSGLLEKIHDLVKQRFPQWDVAIALEYKNGLDMTGLVFSVDRCGIHFNQLDYSKLPLEYNQIGRS